jgi:hypothetical protein
LILGARNLGEFIRRGRKMRRMDVRGGKRRAVEAGLIEGGAGVGRPGASKPIRMSIGGSTASARMAVLDPAMTFTPPSASASASRG